MHFNSSTEPEDLLYFYHPDLPITIGMGSSSFITDRSGSAEQFLQYAPFGELTVSQRNSSFDSRYKFSGKELDDATGYNYFGARYYDSELSMWLSVDPLADERSWVSPYSYVQNSPVMRVDPSGALDTKYVDKEGNTILETNDGSDAVIEVSDDRLDQFQDNISNADDIHSKEWNYDQKSFLTGVEWGDDVENVLMSQHSEEAMIAAQRYWRGDGSFSDYRKSETRAQYQDPEISAQALVMLASLGVIKMPAVKTGSRIVDDILNAGTKLPRVKGGSQISVKGNINRTFNSLSRRGNRISPTQVKLRDGTIITKYPASSGSQTLQINKGGKITKVRFNK